VLEETPTMTNDFTLFGPAHMRALGLLAVLAVAAVLAARRSGEGSKRRLRFGLALGLFACHLTEYSVALWQGWYQLQMLPLEMCDLAAAFGIYALLKRDSRAAGPAWFFALSGTLPALITPELNVTFPHIRFVVYFLEHGLTVITPLVLVIGLGIVPRAGAWFRAFLILNGFAALDGLLNFALGTNFMYLSHKPYGHTPYEWFPAWPGYIAVLELLVLVLFRLLQIPLALFGSEAAAVHDPIPMSRVRRFQ
jgi:hypothetical integral membrane protein (TIGR02206 family)